MIDPKLLRENPDFVKENYKKRQKPELIEFVDSYIDWDEKWRTATKKVNDLRKLKNETAKKISKLKGAEKNEAINETKKLGSELSKQEQILAESEKERKLILDTLPNLLHDSVPYGADEEENEVIRTFGDKPKFNFTIRDHHELMELNDIVELDRARKTSGARFYFLKGKAAILEMAILRFTMDIVMEEGFALFSTPTMVRTKALYGTGFLPLGEEDIYKIQGEDLALVGTSEVSLGSMHMDEVFLKEELPVHYAGLSSCYRTEASATTKDDKGIFRVHEFKKVEMFKFVLPETSWEEQDHLLSVAEKIFQRLGLHYRVVNICTGDIGAVAARKYDIEVWMPGQGRYREVVSCSNCTDYQSRRLKIRYREKEGSPVIGFVHTLNSTALATTRAIVAILENYQQEDGSILIPEALREYTKFDKI
jgi:seryl-tRNA synthetase